MDATKTAKPEPTSVISEGDEFIGVALFPLMPTDGNPITAELFYKALKARLGANGIEPVGCGGLCGPGFIVWTMHTQDRNPALRAIERVIKEMGLWEICEVAFFDWSEEYWRTIHPYGAPLFYRFLTKENFAAARERLGLLQERLLNDMSDTRRWMREIREESQ